MRVFDYVVLYVPNEKDEAAGKQAEIVLDGRLIADDQAKAQFKVSRLISDDWAVKFDDLQIAVRPF